MINEYSLSNVNFSDYKGQVILLVNVPIYSENTEQLINLQKLFEKYKDKNFVVIAVPVKEADWTFIKNQNRLLDNCNISFPVTGSIYVDYEKNSFFRWLKFDSAENNEIFSTAFDKLLFDKNGNFIRKFDPEERISVCERHILSLL